MEDYELDYDVQEVRLGDMTFKVTTVANEALPLEMLLSLQSKSEEISGQRLWEGSLLLCDYLVEACCKNNSNSNSDGNLRGAGKPKMDLQGKSVLELGAGTGVVSMLAFRLGASPLVMTDGDEKCVAMAQKNTQENDIPSDEAFVTVLRWGNTESTTTFCKEFSEWETRRVLRTCMNSSGKNGVALVAEVDIEVARVGQGIALLPGDMAGRAQRHPLVASNGDGDLTKEPTGEVEDRNARSPSPPPSGRSELSSSPLQSFDFILAGDVLYKHCLLDSFLGTVRDMLAPGGRVLLCHVPRAGVTYGIVERAFVEAGLAFEILNGDDNKETKNKEGGEKEDVGGADARGKGAGGSRCDTQTVGGVELCVEDARRARLYELHFVDPGFQR